MCLGSCECFPCVLLSDMHLVPKCKHVYFKLPCIEYSRGVTVNKTNGVSLGANTSQLPKSALSDVSFVFGLSSPVREVCRYRLLFSH